MYHSPHTVTDDFNCSKEKLEPVTLLHMLFQQALSLQPLDLTTLPKAKALPIFYDWDGLYNQGVINGLEWKTNRFRLI